MPVLTGKIIDVRATKKKDGAPEGYGVNINLEDFRLEGDKASVRYTYVIDYNPGIATMQVLGELLVQYPKEKLKECGDKWAKEKLLPLDVAEEVLTAVSYSGTTIGTLLAFAIGINSPISIPRARLSAPPAKPAQ